MTSSSASKPHVLLINPAIGSRSQNKKIFAIINISTPTSLGILASYLDQAGLGPARIVDEQLHPIPDDCIADLLEKIEPPRIVGLSVLTINSGRAYELAAAIKRHDPSALVVLGGIHPTVVPEEALAVPAVDVVVYGEGEETFRELVTCRLEGRSYDDLQGITYIREGARVTTPPRPFMEDLDAVPPFPYAMFAKDMALYPNFACIFGSRGCPYECTFCSSRSISGKRYRHHSVERVVHEIKTLVRTYGQTVVHLLDDNIAVNKRHFRDLCSAIIAEGLHREASFHGSLRGDDATDEVLDQAYAANFRILHFGLETGTERLMKVVNKGESLAVIVDAIGRAAARGFDVGATVIFGLPTETPADRRETARLVRTLPLGTGRFNTLTPYPGTPVHARLVSEGAPLLVKKNWENFGVQYMWESDDIPYVPEGNSRLGLIFDTMMANLSLYLTPRGIMRLFTQKFAGGNVIRLKDHWYLRPAEVKKMADAAILLLSRFSGVYIRYLLEQTFGKLVRSKKAC